MEDNEGTGGMEDRPRVPEGRAGADRDEEARARLARERAMQLLEAGFESHLGLTLQEANRILLNEALGLVSGVFSDAQELSQICITDLFQKYLDGNLPSIDNASAYLKRVLRNRFVDEYRKAKVREPTRPLYLDPTLELESPRPGPERTLLDQELRTRLQYALDQLPEHEAEAVELVVLQNMTITDAALTLGIPRTTLNDRLKAAYKRVRAILRRDGGYLDEF